MKKTLEASPVALKSGDKVYSKEDKAYKKHVRNYTPLNEIHVDMTPDPDLPIRILEAFLYRCACKWEVSGVDENIKILYDEMNIHQDQRKEILERAINILKAAEKVRNL